MQRFVLRLVLLTPAFSYVDDDPNDLVNHDSALFPCKLFGPLFLVGHEFWQQNRPLHWQFSCASIGGIQCKS